MCAEYIGLRFVFAAVGEEAARDYELAEPKFVPAGTKIRAVAAFDNSKQNKANPDPSRTVPWGQQSWDEMFFGSVTYKYVDQSGTRVADAN